MTIYEAIWFFMIYSFLGWVLEVVYHAVGIGKIINRGFLNGPVCPIYGFGVILIFTLADLVYEDGVEGSNLLVLFAGGMFFATAVELFGGWMLDKIFHARWWDYSSEPFNLNGYICLKFSILWGLAIVFVVRVIHPLIAAYSAAAIPEKYGWPILAVLGAVYLADTVVTTAVVHGLNKQIEELDRVQANMRIVSDNLSESLGKNSIRTAQRIEGGKVQAALAQAELRKKVEGTRVGDRIDSFEQKVDEGISRTEHAVEEWYDGLAKVRSYVLKRIIKAFPAYDLHENEETLKQLKQYIEDHWNGPQS